MTTTAVHEGFTVDDLDRLPEDGQRRELLDGELSVSPAPSLRHQHVVLELAVLLRGAPPAGVQVYVAPTDLRLGPHRQVQPDVVVVRRAGLDAARIEQVPLLVVEVLSPATRSWDLVAKRRAYEEAGVPSYWLVDPDAPSLTVLELQDGRYAEVAQVVADQAWRAERPVDVVVRPADLLA